MSITVESMKPKLRTVDHALDLLSRTEPLSNRHFTVGDEVRFHLTPGWHHGIDAKSDTDLVDAHLSLGRGPGLKDYQLTKEAVLAATSFTGLTKRYAARCPAELLNPQLNYWFREGLFDGTRRDYQLLIAGGIGAAITRASVQPFSNLRLLETALTGIEKHFGTREVLVDYKFTHNLRKTHLRLVIPGLLRSMKGTGAADDTWSVGVQIKNSLIGRDQTMIDGYLFRWICTNGAIDTRNSSGGWTRKPKGDESEVYEWARATVDQILGGLEGALDAVQALVDHRVEGETSLILRDVFEQYHVPLPERAKIISLLARQDGPLTMYHIMAAVTQVANEHGMEANHVDTLLRLGGELPYAATSRCDACRRLTH